MKKEEINFEKISFEMIAKISEAKNYAMEAFQLVKNSKPNYEDKLINAKNCLAEAGKLHLQIVAKEAQGEQVKFSVLFMHAEDHFLSTQNFIDVIELLIEQQKEIIDLKKLKN